MVLYVFYMSFSPRRAKKTFIGLTQATDFFPFGGLFSPSRRKKTEFLSSPRSIRYDSRERAPAQLLDRDAGRLGLLLGQCTTGDSTQKEVQQPLAGRRIVEGIADKRSPGRALDEGAQPLRCIGQLLQKEGVDCGVARRQLRRVQIPALVEALL